MRHSLLPIAALVAAFLFTACQDGSAPPPPAAGKPASAVTEPALPTGGSAAETEDPYAFEPSGDLARDYAEASRLYSRALAEIRQTEAAKAAHAAYLEARRRHETAVAAGADEATVTAAAAAKDAARSAMEGLLAAAVQADPAKARIAETCEALRRQLLEQGTESPAVPAVPEP